MTDLKMMDELLCMLKYHSHCKTWKELESISNIATVAMNRLQEAYTSGEMPVITLGLVHYFKERK